MKFYDRTEELQDLREVMRQSFEDHSRMTVLTGRRRIGKTSLGLKALEGVPMIYLFVSRKNEAILSQEYAELIASELGEYLPGNITKFSDVFRALMEIGKRRKFCIFVDEFQEFVNINPSVFSDMQNIWDRYRKETHVSLIISGSVFTLMERIFKDEKEPLFGRADLIMKLNPFTTEVMREILHDHKADYESDDLLALYSITGGVPKYVELLMNNGCTTLDRMIRFITKPDSAFLDEGRNMLIQEFGKQYATYFSILGCIAGGEVTQADIEARLSEKSLGGQLRLLEEKYELIQKKRPILSKQGTQAVRFEIKDLFLRFWFRYFDRYRSLIEIGNTKALAQIIKNDYPIYSGLVLERWFRQRMMESYRYTNIGGWWLPKQGEPFEIDIVTVTVEGDVEAYEVKRQSKKFSPALLEDKVAEMQKHLFKGKDIKTACLSLEDM